MATKVNVISYRKRNGMYMEGTALKGQLVNHYEATSVGIGADGSFIIHGSFMFYNCQKLTSWSVDLPEMLYANNMFSTCSALTSFSGDLPKLKSGISMFYNCGFMKSWTVDLPELTNGRDMFNLCYTLTSFSTDLPSLTDGYRMFQSCKLDATSVLRILDSIPTHSSGTHELHLGKYTNYQTSDAVAAKLRTAGGGTVTTPIPAATDYRCVDDNGNDKGWTITITT